MTDLDTMIEMWFMKKLESTIKPYIQSLVTETVENELTRLIRNSNAKKDADLHPFGCESYDHLLMPFLSNILKASSNLNEVLQRVIKDLYFNKNVRKNHNLKIPADSYKFAYVWNGDGWASMPLDKTLERVTKRANDVLQHYIVGSETQDELAFKNEISKKKYDALVEFTNKVDNFELYPGFMAGLLKQTEHTILTNQHLVHFKANL